MDVVELVIRQLAIARHFSIIRASAVPLQFSQSFPAIGGRPIDLRSSIMPFTPPYSNPGRYAGLLADLPTDPVALAEVARTLIVRYRASGHELPTDTRDEINARWLEHILATDQRRRPWPLTEPRAVTDRAAIHVGEHSHPGESIETTFERRRFAEMAERIADALHLITPEHKHIAGAAANSPGSPTTGDMVRSARHRSPSGFVWSRICTVKAALLANRELGATRAAGTLSASMAGAPVARIDRHDCHSMPHLVSNIAERVAGFQKCRHP